MGGGVNLHKKKLNEMGDGGAAADATSDGVRDDDMGASSNDDRNAGQGKREEGEAAGEGGNDGGEWGEDTSSGTPADPPMGGDGKEDARANHMGSGADDDGLVGGGMTGANDEAMAEREAGARAGASMDSGGKTNASSGAATDLSMSGGRGAPTDLSKGAGWDEDETGGGGAVADAKGDGNDDEGLEDGGAAGAAGGATKKKRKRKNGRKKKALGWSQRAGAPQSTHNNRRLNQTVRHAAKRHLRPSRSQEATGTVIGYLEGGGALSSRGEPMRCRGD